MKKAEAYKVLNITPPARPRQVEQAYWQQAHECREGSGQAPNARERLLELNEAYSVLTSRERLAPLEIVESKPEPDAWSLGWEALVSWVRALIRSTAARWPGRGAEIAALTVCLIGLAGLAIIHAAIPSTLLVLAAGLVVIRAPWRRTH
ncbi:MAG: J domain-containing protein [Dehalococcoidia bacterium]|jgi:hypothetical protein